MKGIWLENREIRLRRDLEQPSIPEYEALVKVKVAGICRTDLEMIEGYYPFTGIPGHEFVGEVVEASSAPERVGERVVGEINASCGKCSNCSNSMSHHCSNRSVLGIVDRNGAFAEFLTLPVSNLLPVPETVSNEAAVFVEPLAAALQIPQQVHFRPDDNVLLIGAGKLGSLIAMVLKRLVSSLTVLARHPIQQEMLAKAGISTVFDTESFSSRFDIVIEASGSRSGFEVAMDWIRPRGKLVLKSTYSGKTAIDCSRIVVDELELIGSRCGPFQPAIELLESGEADPTMLIGSRFPLDKAVEAIETAPRSKLKVLIDC